MVPLVHGGRPLLGLADRQFPWHGLAARWSAWVKRVTCPVDIEPPEGFEAWLKRCEEVEGALGELARDAAEDPRVVRRYLAHLEDEGFADGVEATVWAAALGLRGSADEGPLTTNPFSTS